MAAAPCAPRAARLGVTAAPASPAMQRRPPPAPARPGRARRCNGGRRRHPPGQAEPVLAAALLVYRQLPGKASLTSSGVRTNAGSRAKVADENKGRGSTVSAIAGYSSAEWYALISAASG